MKLTSLLLLSLCALAFGLSGKAWHFTDIHVDPIYVVGSSKFSYCNGNVTTNKSLACGEFGNSEGNCASPVSLYHSAVEFMNHQSPDADFVLFTGDFTQAGLSSEMDVMDTISDTWTRLEKHLPHVKAIYGTLGNHDIYPGDRFPYPWDGYRLIADIWGQFLDEPAKETVRHGGYYTITAAGAPDLQIISINTNYLSTLNPYVSPGDPAYDFGFTMMKWFESELKKQHAAQRQVWILGHIPASDGSWLPQHVLHYQQLIQKYSTMISGQFYGHDHIDHISLTRSCDQESGLCIGAPTGVVWVGPAMTEGFPSANPGIRLYEYDPQKFQVTEAHTFVANVTLANFVGHVQWEHEYTTTEAYQMTDVSTKSWHELLLKMKTNLTLWRQFQRHGIKGYRGPNHDNNAFVICDTLDCGVGFTCTYEYWDPSVSDACAAAANPSGFYASQMLRGPQRGVVINISMIEASKRARNL